MATLRWIGRWRAWAYLKPSQLEPDAPRWGWAMVGNEPGLRWWIRLAGHTFEWFDYRPSFVDSARSGW